jgi:hypothetical protein
MDDLGERDAAAATDPGSMIDPRDADPELAAALQDAARVTLASDGSPGRLGVWQRGNVAEEVET